LIKYLLLNLLYKFTGGKPSCFSNDAEDEVRGWGWLKSELTL